ncbi:hypothetical protein G6F33_013650 [Rhizopus arrhizus]|uniref:Uncharacterized protein n=1 Tax=Rhizopus oryzae TaxID=64495 RepID=A0A9P7C1D3_RHIOR|nr:hypothetical protein G6F23_013005 [Rhizopus arrhizus]KAG1258668.1 hypothetical protein G6F68_008629 [Rhizopus microsporus]KAG1399023.1 hypothetical protein G6F58_011211 [Rhizopus delemar]KAG0766419.1 hypothetical protein G6F24_003620 [Rhizopus arrhizus]KAG0895432.1 hypothetical protein G6F33_013650 [Rhizopus arrhizus]
MNSNQEVQETAAANTKGPVYLDTVENYVKKQYIEQGIEAACQALDNFLIFYENQYKNYTYQVDGLTVSKYQFIASTITRIESEIMEQQEASMVDEEENEEENNEVILDGPLIQNNHSITDDSWFYELCMAEYYEQYRSLLEQQTMINRQKEIVANNFAQNVTEWAHLKFKKPENNQRDIYLYDTAKYNQLKTILPNCTVYRTLVTKMKNHDQWGQIISQTEVGSSLGGGICDAVGVTFAEEGTQS